MPRVAPSCPELLLSLHASLIENQSKDVTFTFCRNDNESDLSTDDDETAVWASLELLLAHEVGEADVLYDLTSGDVIYILTFFLL